MELKDIRVKLEEQADHCPKCGSENVGSRFVGQTDQTTGREIDFDSDDYRVHHDTYVCYDCKFWDFYEAFEGDYKLTADRVHCPVCAREAALEFDFYDWWSNAMCAICSGCNSRYIFESEGNGFFRLWGIRKPRSAKAE